MKSKYSIHQQIMPPTTKPFRIVETVFTCDGYRSRMTAHCFATLTEATEALGKFAKGD